MYTCFGRLIGKLGNTFIILKSTFESYPFRLPNDNTRQKWIDAIKTNQGMDFPFGGYFWICSSHFNKREITTKNGRTSLAHGSIPTKFDAEQPVSQINPPPLLPPSHASIDNEQLQKRLQTLGKIQALERDNASLKKKTKLARAKSVDLEKKVAQLRQKSTSQQHKISELEKQIDEMRMSGPFLGARDVCVKILSLSHVILLNY